MRNRRIVMLGIVLTALTVAVTAQTDVSGTWNIMFNLETGPTPATMTFEQDGEKVMGSLTSDQGTFGFEVTLSGNKLEWTLEVDGGGAAIEVAITGTVDGDEMMGTVSLGGYGGGDWTAKRME